MKCMSQDFNLTKITQIIDRMVVCTVSKVHLRAQAASYQAELS